MNRKTVIIIVVSVVVVICICSVIAGLLFLNRAGNFLKDASSTDPQEVGDTASEISDIQPPPGFVPSLSMNVMGIVMVGYTAPDQQTTVFLFQMPSGAQMSMDQFREQVGRIASQQSGENLTFEQVDTIQSTIRGQAVDLAVLEGSSSSGSTIRQLVGAFEGKGGPAWLIITGPANTWDQSSIDQFLNSMR